MAYQLCYWEDGKTHQRDHDAYDELKHVRIKSVEEVFPLSLPHNRPANTSLITLDRTDQQSNRSLIVWDRHDPSHIVAVQRKRRR